MVVTYVTFCGGSSFFYDTSSWMNEWSCLQIMSSHRTWVHPFSVHCNIFYDEFSFPWIIVDIWRKGHLLSDDICDIVNFILLNKFNKGCIILVRLRFSIWWHYMGNLRLVLSKTNRIGDIDTQMTPKTHSLSSSDLPNTLATISKSYFGHICTPTQNVHYAKNNIIDTLPSLFSLCNNKILKEGINTH